MEQLNRGSEMYCLGCLCIGKEYKIQEYKMRYYPHFKAILEVASLKLCYLCRTVAQHAELFMQNVQRNQIILENWLEDSTLSTCAKPESHGPPPIALTQSSTLTDSLTDQAGYTNNTCEGSFVNVVASTAGHIKIMLPNTLSYIKQELKSSAVVSAGVSHVDVKQELDISIQAESDEHLDYPDVPIKQEKCPSRSPSPQPVQKTFENIQDTDKCSSREDAKKNGTTKRKRIPMKERLESEGIDKMHITLEQCMEERRLKALDPFYQARPYKCTDCVKGFVHKPSYEQHLQRHSAHSGPLACGVCAVRFRTDTQLNKHSLFHTVRYRCRSCGLRRGAWRTLSDHVLARHRAGAAHACPHCHKRFKRYLSYTKHVAYTHRPAARVECDLCRNTFIRKSGLRMHLLQQHPESVGAPQLPRALRCPQCPATFRLAASLRNHARTHSDHRPHYCVECDKAFKTAGALAHHLKTTQTHVNTAAADLPSCSFCQKRFMTIRNRDRHTATVHLHQRPHKCDVCDKGFSYQSEVRKHKRTVHEGHRPPRNFVCNYCDQAFATRVVLTAHIRRHTGERPFQCGECAATFTQNGALHTHRRLVHQKLPKKNKAGGKKK